MLQGRIVGVPADDGQPDVLGQLQEVLAGHGVEGRGAVELGICQVDDDGRAVGQEARADRVQHGRGRRHGLKHVQVGRQAKRGGREHGGDGLAGLKMQRRMIEMMAHFPLSPSTFG